MNEPDVFVGMLVLFVGALAVHSQRVHRKHQRRMKRLEEMADIQVAWNDVALKQRSLIEAGYYPEFPPLPYESIVAYGEAHDVDVVSEQKYYAMQRAEQRVAVAAFVRARLKLCRLHIFHPEASFEALGTRWRP